MTGAHLLDWTGHALVDVGIATICAMASKDDPRQLTLDDLDLAALEMERYYFSGLLMSYLTCVFMNSEYVQPGTGKAKSASRKKYSDRVLRAHRSSPDSNVDGQVCAFSRQPATHQIHRGQMPLLTGESVLNFFPNASGGLFIRGAYLTALQALPLGGRRSEGKILVAYSDDDSLTLAFAKTFLEDNRRLLGLALSNQLPEREGPSESLAREHAAYDVKKKRPKYPDAKSAFTLIATDLLDILGKRRAFASGDRFSSLDVYWLSSSGQGPSIEIFTLPSQLIKFFREVSKAGVKDVWASLLRKGWASEAEVGKLPSKGKLKRLLSGPGRSRNSLLADIVAIYAGGFIDPARARSFVKRHLLSAQSGAITRPEDCSWALTDLFLKEVLGMSPDQIGRVRAFADLLADYVAEKNDRRIFRSITFAKKPWELRNALEKAQRNEYLKNQTLLFSFDEYINVFEAEDNAAFTDWSLVRDLICIRMIEQLYRKNWLVDEDLKNEVEKELDKVSA